MADRIIAALEYLDAHTSFVLQRSKHRSLGDIDSKYEVVDPSEMPLSAVIHDQISLLGIKRTNLSRQKTVDQILDEDRARIVQSAQRTRSAPSRKRIATNRPLTSNSVAVKAKTTARGRRAAQSPQSQMTSSSATVTKMAFTRPGVDVGPSDARDEVMMEIANKPLTHTPPKTRNSSYRTRPLTSTSLPGCGVISVGCRSINSKKRSQTSHGRPSPRMTDEESKWDRKPGPFATVKVSGKDMWVVSDSTPPSYFNGDFNGVESSKLPGWEKTADSIPREEKKSPPRFERQLGAPPQFGPTSQWYSFAGKDPSKQHPILTSFTEKRAGEYYNIESRVSETVLNQLQSNAGIRIGVNGNVVSDSMKVSKKQQSAAATCDEGFSSEGDAEENQSRECTSDPKTGDEASSSGKEPSLASDANDRSMESDNGGDGDHSEAEKKADLAPQEEDRKFTLLRFVGSARGENPYVADSSSASTSSGDLTALLADIARNVKNAKNNDADWAHDDAVWAILREASPAFWISKEKWRRMREDLQRKKSKRVSEMAADAGLPLSWDEQLHQDDARVLKTRLKRDVNNNKGRNDSLPVVFHKLLSYDQLPVGFVHLTNSGYRAHSTVSRVDKDLDFSAPSKGCETTIATPPRSAKSRAASSTNGPPEVAFPARPFTSQSLSKRSRLSTGETGSLDLSHLLRAAQDSISGQQIASQPERPPANKRTEGRGDDISCEELEAMRQEATNSMKLTGRANPKLAGEAEERPPTTQHGQTNQQQPQQNRARAVTLNSLPMKSSSPIATVDIRPSVPKSSVPVSGLNLSELDENYNVINGPNPPSPVSPIRMEEIFDLVPYAPLGSASKFGPPNNTPKTPKVPPGSSKMSGSDARGALLEDRLLSSNESRGRAGTLRQGSKSASTLPRSNGSSPRNYPMQIAGDLPQHSPSRGFHGSPLTGRSQTGRAGQSRFGSTTKTYRTASAAPQMPGSPGAVEYPGKGGTGFIQISHSLHIPPQRPSSAKAEKRNKVFDSYMRELTSRAEQKVNRKAFGSGKSNGVVVKSLGGTSGKILPDHQSPPGRQQPLPSSVAGAKGNAGYQSFSAHGSRRSGLATANDLPQAAPPQAKVPPGNLHLGLQGDPVRLNLDKNIHNIYRDLGILKKSGNGSGHTSPLLRSNVMTYEEVQVVNGAARRGGSRSGTATRRSEGSRSRAQSAVSGDVPSSHSVVTIPTAANSTHDYNDEDVDDLEDALLPDAVQETAAQEAALEEAEVGQQTEAAGARADGDDRIRTSSGKKGRPNEVADSGTQWVSPELDQSAESEMAGRDQIVAETTELPKKASIPSQQPPPLDAVPVRMELDTGAVGSNGIPEEPVKEEDSYPSPVIVSKDAPTSAALEDPRTEDVAKMSDRGAEEVLPDDSELPGTKTPKDAQTLVEQEEPQSNEVENPTLADRRSYSESHIDRVGKDDEEQADKEAEAETDVRGVTKVTVNIPPSMN